MNTTFDTNQFRWTHGRAPRGNGFWFFTNQQTGAEFVFAGNFGDAKRAAAAEFPNTTVTVQP